MAATEEKRICVKCSVEKPLSEFRIRKDKGYHRRECKQCARDEDKKWKLKNSEKLKAQAKKHYNENKEYYAIKYKIWVEDNREHTRKYAKEYRKNNHEKELKRCREYQKNKYKTDINYKLRMLIGGRIRRVLNHSRTNKGNKSIELLGCSLPFLKEYIENLFQKEMSWDKFHNGEIHIDHKIPCASFDLTDLNQQRECFHYSNLQPLWAVDNLRKGSKVG